ncbi:NAD(P)-dependent oxidoreductase [Streptomyces sp. C10-9-1]|uniref:NAD(P)-dependent oxidoreductase n=1 Tax=Streptomyces sp. C10-9-1 TaxID=1859285 RepID=UPI003D761346
MTSRVAVLGTGMMGSGMARSLLRAGLDVAVWNRSAERARPLAGEGALVAASPGQAVSGAGTVVTTLFDAESVTDVMSACADAVAGNAVWLQCTTVGVDGARRLAELASRHGLRTLDAPVLGTRGPAEKGELAVLVSGPSELREAVAPVLAAIGTRTQWAGEAYGAASRLKLAANAWAATLVSGVAQSLALARRLGLEPQDFLDAVAGSAVDAPYVRLKGEAMINEDWTPSFEIGNLLKDLDLVKEAMDGSHTDSTLLDAVRARFAAASAQGYASADMAAVSTAY